MNTFSINSKVNATLWWTFCELWQHSFSLLLFSFFPFQCQLYFVNGAKQIELSCQFGEKKTGSLLCCSPRYHYKAYNWFLPLLHFSSAPLGTPSHTHRELILSFSPPLCFCQSEEKFHLLLGATILNISKNDSCSIPPCGPLLHVTISFSLTNFLSSPSAVLSIKAQKPPPQKKKERKKNWTQEHTQKQICKAKFKLCIGLQVCAETKGKNMSTIGGVLQRKLCSL